ncbi:MAG: class I SAM-dependent methyltransferase [Nitrospirae bacterium]|nr:class I SAM-dependent methyltransferase [Nitrospirota bacterium]
MSDSLRCPGCDETSTSRKIGRHASYRLFRCGACGLVFSQPMAIPEGFYDEFEQPYGWKWEFDAFLAQESAKNRTLLDVGCGDGTFLEMAKKSGYRVHGVDSSRAGIKAARERGLRHVLAGSLDHALRAFGGRFDVVTCFHTLEHVENPSAFLRKVCDFVRRGGTLAIGVPNARRFVVRLRREVGDFPPNHLTRWTDGALKTFLARHRLNVRDVLPETIHITEAKDAGYVIWLAVNALTQTGLIHRQRMRARSSSSGAGNDGGMPGHGSAADTGTAQASKTAATGARAPHPSPGAVMPVLLNVARTAASRIRPMMHHAARSALGGLVLRGGRGRTLQGPGLLAIAEKPGR